MPKQIAIEVPDWIDEKDIRDVIEKYIEMKLPSSATREEYINFLKVDINEIVEYSIDRESEIVKEMREKSRGRCRF
ncbi:MAG: hypothetical protein ACP5KE_06075 [Candidatus Methanodesulfokora sp.]|nr:MAG: hypothetical protein C0200_02250 [Candidatus Korarchaeota archaeon]